MTSRSEKIVDTVKFLGVSFNTFSLVRNVFGLMGIAGIILIAMLFGLPWYIGVPFIFFIIVSIILQIIRVKRIVSAKV